MNSKNPHLSHVDSDVRFANSQKIPVFGSGTASRRPLLNRLESALVTVYRSWSATRPPSCRYSPTCSAYALEALKTHGFLKANRLIVKRIVRCAPWGGFGFDPVPSVQKEGAR